MDRDKIKDFIARRAAMELKDGDIVNLGIGLPTLIPSFLPEGVRVVLHGENGIIGAGPKPGPDEAQPRYVTDAGGKPSSVAPGGSFIDSCVSFGLIRGGHVDCTILGALEVDEKGNLANWIIPGEKVPGMGGAMDLVVGAKKVIVAMEHTAKGKHKILRECRLPLTAVSCVDLIITEMGVMRLTDGGILLTEYNPEFTPEEIQAATEAELIIPDDIREMI
ncbi:MAG: 3-oxoacid CoA-transferase subunit B [Clostridiales Family XIII bacterium]|jgi:acetate CoA/acetoacetate CoA-transferase beta subunit|nr:3-oxoacid CoA-transferase subunit B [Clostridiales Family XIII bacterium]